MRGFFLVTFALLWLLQVSHAEEKAVSANATAACTLGSVTGCDTAAAAGLTAQIVARIRAMGYSFVRLNTSHVHCRGGCDLQGVAASALYKATESKKDYITLNSAYRSCAEQYLLYRWYEHRQCGIQLAAKPGTSNHEGGLAIDTSYYNYWRPALEAHGWRWFGSRDVVHFDYVGSGGHDLRAINLKAFQQLHNRHSSSKIAEDGIYGPATAAALSAAPCHGW